MVFRDALFAFGKLSLFRIFPCGKNAKKVFPLQSLARKKSIDKQAALKTILKKMMFLVLPYFHCPGAPASGTPSSRIFPCGKNLAGQWRITHGLSAWAIFSPSPCLPVLAPPVATPPVRRLPRQHRRPSQFRKPVLAGAMSS